MSLQAPRRRRDRHARVRPQPRSAAQARRSTEFRAQNIDLSLRFIVCLIRYLIAKNKSLTFTIATRELRAHTHMSHDTTPSRIQPLAVARSAQPGHTAQSARAERTCTGNQTHIRYVRLYLLFVIASY